MDDHSSKSRDRFAAFALSGADVLLETDMNGRVLFSTGATVSLIGYSADLMTGRRLTQIMVPDDADMVREVLDRVAITGRVTGMIVRRADGKHYPFSLSGVSVVESKGALHFTMARLKGLSAKIAFEPGVMNARVFMNLANDLIGLAQGEVATWVTRDGQTKKLTVAEVLYQPEADGRFDL
jgi:PAS domain S-box-containing protein